MIEKKIEKLKWIKVKILIFQMFLMLNPFIIAILNWIELQWNIKFFIIQIINITIIHFWFSMMQKEIINMQKEIISNK